MRLASQKNGGCVFEQHVGISSEDNGKRAAFTLVELLFAIAAVALLMVTAVPLLGNTRLRTDRSSCANNLRQIGIAFQSWGDSHDDKLPWLVPASSGGTAPNGSPTFDLAFVHFSTLSNDLPSPSLLACPSDTGRVSSSWTFESAGGFLNPAYRNNALSYLVGAHAETSLASSVVSADRNISADSYNSGCSVAGFARVAQVNISTRDARSAWLGTSLHGNMGNVLMGGGAVLELDSDGFKAVQRQASDFGAEHYLLPR